MSKKSTPEYNKGTMKTLDAKALKAKKDNLQAEFESEKRQALACEDLVAKATKKREGHLEKMSQLQGAYKAIEDLEKSIGVKLPANEGKEKPAKP
jgi:hypothetical protein